MKCCFVLLLGHPVLKLPKARAELARTPLPGDASERVHWLGVAKMHGKRPSIVSCVTTLPSAEEIFLFPALYTLGCDAKRQSYFACRDSHSVSRPERRTVLDLATSTHTSGVPLSLMFYPNVLRAVVVEKRHSDSKSPSHLVCNPLSR
jgi:hypothetical protein